jgi:hypothetical protein
MSGVTDYGVTLALRGVPGNVISQLMGHVDPRATSASPSPGCRVFFCKQCRTYPAPPTVATKGSDRRHGQSVP